MPAPKGNQYGLDSGCGRPSSYTQDMADRICARIAMGHSLRSICEPITEESDTKETEETKFPTIRTVYAWFRTHEEFLKQYAHAKDDSADADNDRIASVAEDVLAGNVDANAARVAIDAFKWMAGKKRPKKYGDRTHTEVSGELNLSTITELALDDELMTLLQASKQAE